jgi:predicted lipoprotein
MRRIAIFIFSGLLLMNIYGCFALFAGAAGGAGTSMWLSGKLSQEFQSPYEQTITASKRALESLKLEVTKETKEGDVTQLRSNYSDGKEIWIDIRKITANSTKVEVRVGAVNPDKEAADMILKKIQSNL